MVDFDERELDRKPAPLPEPLGFTCVDSHAHIELLAKSEPNSPQVDAVISEAASVGINRLVQVGYDSAQSAWGVEAAKRFPGVMVAAVALHPNEAPVVEDLEKELTIIDSLAGESVVRAIGETGLDYFRTPEDLLEIQRYSFKRHIEIAKKYDKALVIHDRDAHRDVLDTLLEVGAPKTVVFHCFSGDKAMAEECIEAGYYLSYSGTVTFKNSPALREAALITPRDLILVETDSPFLAPMPHRGTLNAPSQIPNILRFISELRGEEPRDLADSINANATRVFGEF
jgi:TatD DNase family protein